MTKVKICASFNDITMTLQILILQKYIEKPKTLIIKYKFMNNCCYLFFWYITFISIMLNDLLLLVNTFEFFKFWNTCNKNDMKSYFHLNKYFMKSHITYLITYIGNKSNKESEENGIHRSSKYGITNQQISMNLNIL